MGGREQAQESELQLGKAPSGNEALSAGLAGLGSAVVNLWQEKTGIHEGKQLQAHSSGNLTPLWAPATPGPPGPTRPPSPIHSVCPCPLHTDCTPCLAGAVT